MEQGMATDQYSSLENPTYGGASWATVHGITKSQSRLSDLACTHALKAIYSFSVIPIKLPMIFSTKLEKIILKFIWTYERPRIAKPNLKKKTKAGGIIISDFRQYYKATVIKIVSAQKQTYRSREQNRENRYKPIQLIFGKGGKNMQWRKDSLFTKWCWESWTATCKSMKSEHSFTQHTKINSKWFKDT